MRGTSLRDTIQSCVRTFGTTSVAVVGLLLTAGAASAQIFQDNMLEYRYGTPFKEPGVANAADITKSIVTYVHVDGYKWGGDFLALDILMSTAAFRPIRRAALDRRTGALRRLPARLQLQ